MIQVYSLSYQKNFYHYTERLNYINFLKIYVDFLSILVNTDGKIFLHTFENIVSNLAWW